MCYQEYIQVSQSLIFQSQTIFSFCEENILIETEKNHWLLSVKISFSSELEEMLKNIQTMCLTSKDLFLTKKEEEIFLIKKTPPLDRYTFFRRYVTQYLSEIKEWRDFLEKHSCVSDSVYKRRCS